MVPRKPRISSWTQTQDHPNQALYSHEVSDTDDDDHNHDVDDGHSYFQDHPNQALYSDEVSDNHDHQY